jgi:hypothetical protein
VDFCCGSLRCRPPRSSAMPLTLEKLKELQEEALADDCEIEIERMASWTEAQVLLQNCATEDT